MSRRSEHTEFWQRTRRLWDVFFYLAIVIVALATLVAPGERGAAIGSLVCLAVLAVAYTFMGRRAAMTGSRGLALAYLLLLIVVTVVQIGLDNLGGVLLFVAYSQIWFFSESRWVGAVLVAVLSVAVAARFAVAASHAGESVPAAIGAMAVSFVFAIVLGLWVTEIAERGEERAQLLEQLETAQAELAATHHAAGVVAERERLAQEIHDTLAQGFTSVVMLAQTTDAELARGRGEAARERVAQIEQVARENLAEARALVAAFGPAGLEDATLSEALARLTERFAAQTGIDVTLAPGTATAAAGLERDVQVALLRATQEALANVRKHAGATHVTLGLARVAGSVRLEVADDGRGIPAGAPEGAGLRGMRERARVGGGELAVAGMPGAGTRVALTLPVGGADDEGGGR